MNQIGIYLDKLNKIISEDKARTLIALGLTEKEYAPDGKESWKYSKVDYINGEKKYYRDVAISVTDEEYALILIKAKQVEEIRAKEEQQKQHKVSYRVTKKWIPVFEKQKSDSYSLNEETVDDGRSRIATILRTVSWIIGILAVVAGIAISFETDNFLTLFIVLGTWAVEMLMFYALAAVLDYLAELTSIARHGFKYNESNK